MRDKPFERAFAHDPIDGLDFPCPDASLEIDEMLKITSGDCKPNAIDGMC